MTKDKTENMRNKKLKDEKNIKKILFNIALDRMAKALLCGIKK